jgi:hypothetical protein
MTWNQAVWLVFSRLSGQSVHAQFGILEGLHERGHHDWTEKRFTEKWPQQGIEAIQRCE